MPVGVAWIRPLAPSSAARRSVPALARAPSKCVVQSRGERDGPRRVPVEDDEPRRARAEAPRPRMPSPLRPRRAGPRTRDPPPAARGGSPSSSRSRRCCIRRARSSVRTTVLTAPMASRRVGHRVEQRDDRLLAGIGDVQPGEAHDARRFDERGQRLRAAAGRVEVDELVVQANAVVAGFLLLQGRGQRALDAGADEAAEQRLFHCPVAAPAAGVIGGPGGAPSPPPRSGTRRRPVPS